MPNISVFILAVGLVCVSPITPQIISESRLMGVPEAVYEKYVRPTRGKEMLEAVLYESAHSGSYAEIGKSQAIFYLKHKPNFRGELLEKLKTLNLTNASAAEIRERLRSFFPEILDEISGFSSQLGIETDQAIRYFALYGSLQPGCSIFVASRQKSANGHLLIGRNYDWIPTLADLSVVALRPRNAHGSLGNAELIFGRLDGYNDKGLFAAMAASRSKKTGPPGFFFPIILRAILDKNATIDEALAFIQKIPVTVGYNVVLADSSGRAALVQITPDRLPETIWLQDQKDGILVATNHFVSDKLARENLIVMPGSLERFRKIKRLLGNKDTAVNQQDIRQVLAAADDRGVFLNDYSGLFGTLYSGVYDLDAGIWELNSGKERRTYDIRTASRLTATAAGVRFQNKPADLRDYVSTSPLGLTDINKFYWHTKTFLFATPVAGLSSELGFSYKMGLHYTEKTYGPNAEVGVFADLSPADLRTGIRFAWNPLPLIEFEVRPFFAAGWKVFATEISKPENAAIIAEKLNSGSSEANSSPAADVSMALNLGPLRLDNKFTFLAYERRVYDFRSGLPVKDTPIWSPSALLLVPYSRKFLWGLRAAGNHEFSLKADNIMAGPIFVFPELLGPLNLSVNLGYWFYNSDGQAKLFAGIALMGIF